MYFSILSFAINFMLMYFQFHVIIIRIFQISGFYNFLYALPLKNNFLYGQLQLKKQFFTWTYKSPNSFYFFSFLNYNISYIFLKNNNINNIFIVFNCHVIVGTELNFHTKVPAIIFFIVWS